MKRREAACSCGQLRLVAEGEPLRVSACHCLACQRRSGSAFAVQARFPEEKVALQGEGRDHVRPGGSGQAISFTFCPHCGSTLCYACQAEPGVIAVPVGPLPIRPSRRRPCRYTRNGAMAGVN
ncbi:GFA family protein [Gallaecimonas sp. GXIMD4217]|uniref:GFA family protein n=1 Tax=Gallaecimonas sp. GXIMD4217 TaxID=3131927 RepID=UPI00311B36F6